MILALGFVLRGLTILAGVAALFVVFALASRDRED